MKNTQDINTVLDIAQDWDSNWNEVLLYQSKENDWSEIQKIEFLHIKELELRRNIESVLNSITMNKSSAELFDNVRLIMTDDKLGIQTLVFEELVYMHRSWVIENYLDEDIFNKEFNSLFEIIGEDTIIKKFSVLSEEINLLVSLVNCRTSKIFHGSNLIENITLEIIEHIKLDLVALLKQALFETDEISLHPVEKKSLKEVHLFEDGDTAFTRVVTWRNGELLLDLKTGEVRLGFCFDKCNVEYDQDRFEIKNDIQKSETDIFDELESKGFEVIDSWFEIDGRTMLSIDCSDQEIDL